MSKAPKDPKSVSVWRPTRRGELAWGYGAAYTFFVLIGLWSIDDWAESPEGHLILCGVLAVGYVVILLMVWHYFDKKGARINRTPWIPVRPEK